MSGNGAQHTDLAEAGAGEADRAASRRLNILVMAHWLPRPDIAAGDQRLFGLLEWLARRHRVTILGTRWVGEIEATTARLRGAGIEVLSKEVRWWEELAFTQHVYDVVLFEFWACAEEYASRIRRIQPWARVIVDTVDVHFLREEAGVALGLYDAREVAERKERELGVYRDADTVVVVTEEDRAALAGLESMPPLSLIPLMIPTRSRPALAHRQREMLFVGGFNHAPNADGLLWFVREVWPAVRAGIPDARLTVVGSYPPDEVLALGKLEGIEVAGYVPETAPYLDRAAVSIAPLRFGAGMKGKVVEALASALPVVTTTVGAQGLGATSGEHLEIADTAEGFAAACVRLLGDPEGAARMGRAGQELAAALCGPESVCRRLDAMLEAAQPRRPLIPPWSFWREVLHYQGGTFVRLPLRVGPIQRGWKAVKSRLKAGSVEAGS